jgi:hypothetical protein
MNVKAHERSAPNSRSSQVEQHGPIILDIVFTAIESVPTTGFDTSPRNALAAWTSVPHKAPHRKKLQSLEVQHELHV